MEHLQSIGVPLVAAELQDTTAMGGLPARCKSWSSAAPPSDAATRRAQRPTVPGWHRPAPEPQHRAHGPGHPLPPGPGQRIPRPGQHVRRH
ncbi:hypothetical protein C0J52_04713 [Blattella germanica]|nr:hypothetical protein C0J52_04713 [Blattella germanica]